MWNNNFVACLCAQRLIILYSGDIWWGKSLANLVNHLQFDKLTPSKLVVTINNLLADLFIHQTFITEVFIHPLSPNIIAAKLTTIIILWYTLSYTLDLHDILNIRMIYQ